MKEYPLRVSRPSVQFDGDEVYFTFDPENSSTVYGEVAIHEGEPVMVCKTDEDIRVGDIVEVPNFEGTGV